MFDSRHVCLDFEGGSDIPLSTKPSAGETVCSSSDVVQVKSGSFWYGGSILSWKSDVVTAIRVGFGENTYPFEDVRQLDTGKLCTSIKPGMHVHQKWLSIEYVNISSRHPTPLTSIKNLAQHKTPLRAPLFCSAHYIRYFYCTH